MDVEVTDIEGENPETQKEDPIAVYILAALEGGKQMLPRDIAMTIAADRARPADPPDLWRKYMLAVRQQAKRLARDGRIEMVRDGKPVDPEQAKGLFKLRLPVAS